MNQAQLIFLPSYQPEGFNSKVVASDSDTNPAVIIRELIQNSMDAADLADRSRCKVEFRIETVPKSEIPGLETYQRAFEAAKETHKENIESASALIERIESQLAKDTIQLLHVIDNGVGLNPERMNRLLGDGVTNKTGVDRNASGSYGVGHYTAFPTSDLQYILYGGVASNSRTMSGHAILASHVPSNGVAPEHDATPTVTDGLVEPGYFCGKDGFFIKGRKRDHTNPFEFGNQEDTPQLVADILSRIENSSGNGSVVSIVGFNNFRSGESDSADSETLHDILSSVASSFFIPVCEQRLQVSVANESTDRDLSDVLLEGYLRERSTNKRRTKKSVQNGRAVYAAYRTFTRADETVNFDTSHGSVTVYYRESDPGEPTNLSLYRNGMYITSDIPNLQPHIFSAYKRFNAVLRVDSTRTSLANHAFQLIRGAEGEKHLDLNRKRLTQDQQREFSEFLSELRDHITKNLCTVDNTDSFTPAIFNFDFSNGQNQVSRPKALQAPKEEDETLEEIQDTETDLGGDLESEPWGDGDSKVKKKKRKRQSSRNMKEADVRLAAKRIGQEVEIHIVSNEDLEKAILRLKVHSGSDRSCVQPLADGFTQIEIIDPTANSHKPASEIRLDPLHPDDSREINVRITNPDPIPSDAALKVLVLRDTATINK